jgi:hypothetical protein
MKTSGKRPIQVYLRPPQLEALRYLALRRGSSVAALVRQGVDRLLAEVPVEEDSLLDIVGIVEDGPSDLAEKHDEYIVRWLIEENSGRPPKSS